MNAFEKRNIFKYLEDTLFKYCSSTTDIRMMIATATAAMAWLDRVWLRYNTRFTTKYNQYSLV